MKKFWAFFFFFWPAVALYLCWVAPANDWWFPPNPGEPGSVESGSPLGRQIDDLFYLILVIVAVVFIATEFVLAWVVWKGATWDKADGKALFTHGNHNLEVIWTIVPAAVLLFIALYQMDVWAQYRVIDSFPLEAREHPVAEVTARQFEWRIRYPAPGTNLELEPQLGDLYDVNELHVPTGHPVMIRLRSDDVQHAFFAPELRVKQDAIPGLVIPVWFEVTKRGQYSWLCAELCGWGHYKMKARIIAQPVSEFEDFLLRLQREQNYDGVTDVADAD